MSILIRVMHSGSLNASGICWSITRERATGGRGLNPLRFKPGLVGTGGGG
jgi:hypothetical protein